MILDDFQCKDCGFVMEQDSKSKEAHICPYCNLKMEKVYLQRPRGYVVWDGKRV